MAGEIALKYPTTGLTVKVEVCPANGTQVWDGAAFAAYSAIANVAAWRAGLVSLTEQALTDATVTGHYVGNFSGFVTGQEYTLYFYSGATPSPGDPTIGQQTIRWTGTAIELINDKIGYALAADQAVNASKIGGQTATAAGAMTVGAYVGGTGAAALETTAQSILTDTAEIGAAGAGLTSIPDSAGVGTLLTRIPAALFSGITSLAQWLGLIAGKQAGNATARTEIRATGAGAGTFDETTDSQEALRDRGDAAWITATGFSTLDAAGVRTAVGLAAANLDTQLGDIPTIAEFNARTLVSASYATAAICTEARLAELDAANLPTDIAAVKSDTAAILVDTGTDGVVVATGSKTGYSLAAAGLDSIPTTDPGGVAATFPQMFVQLWRRFFKKATKTSSQIKTFADDGMTTRTTQTVSDDGTTETQGAAS